MNQETVTMGENKGKIGCTGFTIKMIAVITMLIDHTAATILERSLLQLPAGGIVTSGNYDFCWLLYQIMRTIGRMAFPLYCYLIVEGFLHTRNVKKYLLRLGIFAVLSEVPFDMAFNNSFWDISYNNVFITLFLGLLVISVADYFGNKLEAQKATWFTPAVRSSVTVGICMVGMILANLLRTDYAAAGIAAITIMYLCRKKRMLGFTLGVVALGVMCSFLELAALLMLIPLHFYNGERGYKAKYFFYFFYPVHLLILSGICYLMGLGI